MLLLAPLALRFVGGARYADVQSHLWTFAVLDTPLLLVAFTMIYSVTGGLVEGWRATGVL